MSTPRPDAPAPRSRLTPDARREQILLSATEVFTTRPYGEVSTAELARRAGVTRGLVHHYFGGRQGLFLAVVRRQVMMPWSSLDDVAGDTLAERVSAAMDVVLDAAETFGRAWVVFDGTGGLGSDAEVAAVVAEADDRAARIVLGALGFDEPDDRLVVEVRTFAALVKAACREWLVTGALPRDEAHRLLTVTLTALVEAEPR
ncbi:TetR/AcrR family transcriptional regulator [Solicola sp. PLA-1-18]|uniref:TetR/AcrR family transcriptional regulator n=1 Tax=Solicola sp. PLA-1-18 TaxID=3380532 RepID=UPI003B81F965